MPPFIGRLYLRNDFELGSEISHALLHIYMNRIQHDFFFCKIGERYRENI